MKIVEATQFEIPIIMLMGEAMHKESSFASMDYDFQRIGYLVYELLASPDGFVRVVKDDKGRVIGGMLGQAVQSWFGKDKVAIDYAVYVNPQDRGNGRMVIRLVDEFIAWAKTRGVKQIRPGVSTGEAGQSLEGIYAHKGFKRCGASFYLDV